MGGSKWRCVSLVTGSHLLKSEVRAQTYTGAPNGGSKCRKSTVNTALNL